MSYQNIPLLAGVPCRLDIAGKLLLVDSVGVAGAVDVAMVRGGTPSATMPARMPGFRLAGDFDGVMLTAAVDTVVGLFLSFDDVNLGTNRLQISNPAADPVNVLFAGTVAPVLGNVKVSNVDAEAVPVVQKIGAAFTVKPDAAAEFKVRGYQAQAVSNVAPAAVAAAAAVFLAADPARRGFRVKNNGANAVAIGGAGLTFGNAAVLVQPGETWNENEAAGAEWSAICDAAMASTLNIQTIA